MVITGVSDYPHIMLTRWTIINILLKYIFVYSWCSAALQHFWNKQSNMKTTVCLCIKPFLQYENANIWKKTGQFEKEKLVLHVSSQCFHFSLALNDGTVNSNELVTVQFLLLLSTYLLYFTISNIHSVISVFVYLFFCFFSFLSFFFLQFQFIKVNLLHVNWLT